MENILLTFAATAIALLLIVAFFRKENVKNKETTIYSILLILNLLFSFTGIGVFLYAKMIDNHSIIGLLQKFYLIEMLFMIILMLLFLVID